MSTSQGLGGAVFGARSAVGSRWRISWPGQDAGGYREFGSDTD